MTVKELIEFLSTVPPDLTVIYNFRSDYAVLEAQDIMVQRSTDECKSKPYYVVAHHNRPGEYRMYTGEYEHKGSPPPVPADVVIFPGN